jgi:hypothetical protein
MGQHGMLVRIKQNYKLIPEKSLVRLAVSQYDTDTVEFVHYQAITTDSRHGDAIALAPYALADTRAEFGLTALQPDTHVKSVHEKAP